MNLKAMLVMCSLASAADSSHAGFELYLYIAGFISLVAGVLLFFAYYCMKDTTLLFAAIALIASATLSVWLPAWWPLASGWLIACTLIMLISGAYRDIRRSQAHNERF
jgi:hypothetical protein